MPWIPDKIGESSPGAGDGEIVTNEWANSLRDAATVHFATTAERDTYWPAATAPLGALCTTGPNGTSLWHCCLVSGTRRWVQPWATAWGYLNGAASGTEQAGITGPANIAGLDVTAATVPGRRLRVNVGIQAIANTVATNGASVAVLVDGTTVRSSGVLCAMANVGVALHFDFDAVSTAMSHRFIAQITNFGGGSVTVNKAAQYVGSSFLYVTDVGPAVVPT